jgi:hypothetical protein
MYWPVPSLFGVEEQPTADASVKVTAVARKIAEAYLLRFVMVILQMVVIKGFSSGLSEPESQRREIGRCGRYASAHNEKLISGGNNLGQRMAGR